VPLAVQAQVPASIVLLLRAEAAAKIAAPVLESAADTARDDALVAELSLGPCVRAMLPLGGTGARGTPSLALVLELGAAGKLFRQSYVLASGVSDDTPYRAHVGAGLEIAWD
jgi:hypothetical protein